MRALKLKRLKREVLALSLLLVFAIPGAANAGSPNLSHSYSTDNSIAVGSLVSLDQSRKNYVQPANTTNGTRLLGVVVPSNDSLLAVDASATTVQVATAGTATVLVSDINGSIKAGDQIAASPINGVGMKYSAGAYVAGLSGTSFSASTSGATKETVKDKTGKEVQVSVGYVQLDIGAGSTITSNSGQQLSTLQRWIKSWTGHTLSVTRIILSLVVACAALVTLVVLIYGAIYATIISVGRNPLAKNDVFRTLASVLGMAAITAVVAGLTLVFLLS